MNRLDVVGAIFLASMFGCDGGDGEVDPSPLSYSLEEDVTLVVSAADGLLPQNARLTLLDVSLPDHGALSVESDGSFRYQPEADFFGEDQFAISLGTVGTEPVTRIVNLEITAVPDAPWVGSVVGYTAPGQEISLDLLASAFDPEGDAFEVIGVGDAGNGDVALSGNVATYTSADGFEGADRFSFTVRDETGAESEIVATVIVLPEFQGSSDIELVSKNAGGETSSRDIIDFSISANGRFVGFLTEARNLTEPFSDLSQYLSVYLLDRATGAFTLVSKSSDGVPANDHCQGVSISGDGNYIVYSSEATNLIDSDFNAAGDVFLYSRRDDTTRKVTHSPDGGPANGRSERGAIISADGSTVAFTSFATNLVASEGQEEIGDGRRVFLYSVETDEIQEIVSPGIGTKNLKNLSGDGRFLALTYVDQTTQRKLGEIHDALTGRMRQLGTKKEELSISLDGQSYLRAVGAGQTLDLYSGEFLAEEETLLTHAGDFASQLDGHVGAPSFSDNGFAVFHSDASNLVGNDRNGTGDIFVTPVANDVAATRVSVSADGEEGLGSSTFPQITLDGKWIFFRSRASNFPGFDHAGYLTYVVRNPLAL